tara:strand:- start:432 stop:3095 length:2664 start_codon:yes stop_codon:yes gene_type:complete
MKKAQIKVLFTLLTVVSCLVLSCNTNGNTEQPLNHEREEHNPDKTAIWTPEQAARHQQILVKLVEKSKNFTKKEFARTAQNTTYANGALTGDWTNRGPKNMPGAFKFAEMLDGTDVIYGVSHNHYAGEFNSKSYIFKGTVYNQTTQSGGDDFQLLTANWPNRYQNLFAFQINQATRLVAHIENGPLYYSDDEGDTWMLSTGLPDANTSSAINRQDNHTLYVTNNTTVYVSTDFGVSFSALKNFGSSKKSFLYTPRYDIQSSASSVYIAREGSFYKLNNNKTDFDLKGSYFNSSHGNRAFSISGDTRLLYVTEWGRYWVSTDDGVNWIQKFPPGSYYGNPEAKMSAGKFFAVHPENPDISVAGYANPIISLDGLDTTKASAVGWGRYQNGTNLDTQAYYNRIRFNYHPDFQSSHFFYNASNEIFSLRCTDGGLFISYKEWSEFPETGVSFDNSDYANAHYINLNVINTVNPLVYRENVFTGKNDPNHINFSTQDQGSQSIIPGTSGDQLDFYQSIGGDGPPLDSYDGDYVWKWDRRGNSVYAPVRAYNSDNSFKSVGQINSGFNSATPIDLVNDTDMGWIQNYIDHNEPDKRMWLLKKRLDRATDDGTNFTAHTVDKGTNQVAALAQAWTNPNKLFMLQDGNVFISNDRGDTFGDAISTPFSQTNGGGGNGDIGSGVVLPNNDDWILFSGPSNNSIGSILSTNGGSSWTDVTGDFPSGSDAQTGGMIVTPDSKYIFAGTDIGPYVFVVDDLTWYSIAEGIGFFNAMDVDYIESISTVRFGSWGSGILDFTIIDPNLDVDKTKDVEALVVFPNPAKNFVNLKLGGFENSKVVIQLSSLEGKMVLNKNHEFQTNLKSVTLDISSILPGIYLVTILDETKKQFTTQRLIVK